MEHMDAYIRVSRVGGRTGEAYRSPALQRAAIEQWAQVNDVTIGRVVQEEDVSGAIPVADRSLEQLIKRAEEGASGGIIVDKVDRFGRTMSETVISVKRLKDVGARLVGAGDGFDSTHQYGALLLGLFAGLAEVHLDNIRSGWARATAAAVAEGIHISARTPLGYLRADRAQPTYDDKGVLIRNGRLVPDPAASAAITQAFKMRADGSSHGEIATFLSERTGRVILKGNVTGILRNRTYLGEARGPNGAVNRTAHEPIVTEDVFLQVQDRVGKRPPVTGTPTANALLGGLITCAGCGNRLRVVATMKGEPSYVCHGRSAAGRCPARAAARVHLVDPLVVDELAQAWDDIAEGAASAEQVYLEAQEALRQAEDALLAWVEDTAIQLAVSAETFTAGILAREAAAEAARRVLWDMDDPVLPDDAPVVYVNGKPFLYELWGDDLERDRRHLRSVISSVTLTKADPARRKWQPMSERLTITWRGEEAAAA